MKRILVTGANKGIGFAIVEKALSDDPNTFMIIGSRDLKKGQDAMAELFAKHSGFQSRLEVLQLDVGQPASVKRAAEEMRSKYGTFCLYGIVNNAGVGGTVESARDVINTNFFGPKIVTEEFAPLVQAGGRIVNMSSGAGPKYVSELPHEQKSFWNGSTSPTTAELVETAQQFVAKAETASGQKESLPSAYNFSKALVNLLTINQQKEFPSLTINSCSPGMIETDMTKTMASEKGKSAKEMGAKPTQEGAATPVYLLLDPNVKGRGWYYGSDGKRSPLDTKRDPGSPEYNPQGAAPPEPAAAHS